MKKLFILFAMVFAGVSASHAQEKKAEEKKSGPAPDIQVTENNHDFGQIEEGPDYTHVFKVKNTGKGDLIINKVNTPCGCTSPTWTKEPIKAGKTGEITATYHSAGRVGVFTKTLSVETNMGEGHDQFLTIRGEVKPKGSVPAKTGGDTKKEEPKK